MREMILYSTLFLSFFTFNGFAELKFNQDIRPILSELCFHCHGPDEEGRKGDLRLDVEADAKRDLGGYAAIVAGKPEQSEIIYRISTKDPDEIMPPPKEFHTIKPEQIETLKTWIKEGAKYEKHWAFTKIEKLKVDSNEHPIDYFIQSKLKEKNLEAAALARPEIQLRRVSLDLTGLPPSLEETAQYEREIEKLGQDQAYRLAVDRLLASPRYGERMAWQWLEASRYADTDGYQNDGPREMWRWRDWVIQAYNKNMPFDQFTIEQLAGDLLPNPTHEQIIATAFNRNNRYNSESGIPIDEFLLENAVDRVDTTSTIWMGLTMGCARCHDHKYDPISQKDYYQLIDYFNDVAESGRAIKHGNSEPWIKTPLQHHRDSLKKYDQNIQKLESKLKRFQKELTPKQLAWEKAQPKPEVILKYGLDHHFDFEQDHKNLKALKGHLPPQFTKGQKGQALLVQKNQNVDFGKIDGLICNGRFTIAFWMKPHTHDEGIVLSNEKKGTRREGIFVEFVDGHLRWNINSRWIAGVATIETLDRIPLNEWVHVTLSNDASQTAGGMKLYLDGELQKVKVIRNTNSNKSGRNVGDSMLLGTSRHTRKAWKGEFDDMRFYTSRTLSEREVKLLALPQSFEELMKRPVDQRTALQKEFMFLAYLEYGAGEEEQKVLADLNETRNKRTAFWDSVPTTMITRDLPEGRDSYIRKRGIYDQLGEKVSPGVPSELPPLPNNSKNDRLAFAKWLVSPEHPLTARVTVNRYWQLLFGRGLVKTSEDFGSQGEAPSHPKLLDWLAASFVEGQWNIKAMLKTIVMSHTYRQSSQVNQKSSEIDPDNIYLSHAPRLRLHGNFLRDQALYAADMLVEKKGGPSVKPYQPAGLWKEASNFKYVMGKGEDLHRRSLYTYWKRTLAPPTMAVLDTADREYCSVKPKFTNTPLQALTLLNDFTFVEAARGLAESILIHGGQDDKSKIQYAFKKLTARQPDAEESSTLLMAFQKYRKQYLEQPEAAKTLVQLNQKNYSSPYPIHEMAATMTLANVLLNLDEVTTRN